MKLHKHFNLEIISLSFIIPPDNSNFQPFKMQQLTAMYLLTIIEKVFGDKLDLSIIDLRGIATDYIKYHIPERDVYCYTAFSPLYDTVCGIRDIIVSTHPNSLHIVGGPHIDLFPNSIVGFDAIALGEGEANIIQIVKDIIDNNLKKVYQNKSLINLDDYPFPSRKYQPSYAVADTGFFYQDKNMLGANVLFSRGCPFSCHFCANLNLGPTRYRSPHLVEAEIEYLKSEFGVQGLVLRDDNSIPINKKIAKPFLQALEHSKVKWRGQARANGISEDMVELAAKSGCLDLALGVESVSPKVLEIINKKIDLSETRKFIKILKSHGIGVKLLLILGLPGESDDVVSRTLDFIDETDPNVVGLALFCPLPGSKMTTNYRDFGIKNINPNISEYQILYGRFDEKEETRMMYEFEEMTPWGKGMKPETILYNYNLLQDSLRQRNLIY